ncbi:hypothetical protein GCM10020001_062880 [Nonomuraea salmonea]
MDLLSDVVALMRTGRPISARISWRAPWSHAFPSAPGSASFHIVLRGSCWFVPSTGEPVPLSVGDVLFLPHGDAYGLADDPDEPLPPPVGCSHDDPELFASAGVGGSGAETVTLTCGYRLHPRVSHPILRSLPPVIHLPATLGCHPELRAAVELLAGEIDNPRPGADTIVTSLLDAVQLYVLRAWFSSDELCTCGGWAAALSDPAIGPALDAMHRAPRPPLDRRVARRPGGPVAGRLRPPLHRAGGDAAAGVPDVVAARDGGAAAARVGRAGLRGGRAGRLRLGVRVRQRLQARVRRRARQVPPPGASSRW